MLFTSSLDNMDKLIWTESDFEQMRWHDATVWSMFANTEDYEYILDMDYIFNLEPSVQEETSVIYCVAPVTMVFENAHSVEIDIDSPQGFIEITELHMEDPILTSRANYREFTYRFDCHEGLITLKASGFKMHVRKPPALRHRHSFDLSERGGISFERALTVPCLTH